jgi:hypothetical protein
MSSEPSSQSEIVPAIMLAMLVAVTGLEAAYLVAAPHKAIAHPAPVFAPRG